MLIFYQLNQKRKISNQVKNKNNYYKEEHIVSDENELQKINSFNKSQNSSSHQMNNII